MAIVHTLLVGGRRPFVLANDATLQQGRPHPCAHPRPRPCPPLPPTPPSPTPSLSSLLTFYHPRKPQTPSTPFLSLPLSAKERRATNVKFSFKKRT